MTPLRDRGNSLQPEFHNISDCWLSIIDWRLKLIYPIFQATRGRVELWNMDWISVNTLDDISAADIYLERS